MRTFPSQGPISISTQWPNTSLCSHIRLRIKSYLLINVFINVYTQKITEKDKRVPQNLVRIVSSSLVWVMGLEPKIMVRGYCCCCFFLRKLFYGLRFWLFFLYILLGLRTLSRSLYRTSFSCRRWWNYIQSVSSCPWGTFTRVLCFDLGKRVFRFMT